MTISLDRVKSLCASWLLFFSFVSFESFWRFIGVGYNGIVELALAVLVFFAIISRVNSVYLILDRYRHLLLLLLLPFFSYILIISFISGVSRADLFVYVLFSQFISIVFTSLIIASNLGATVYRHQNSKKSSRWGFNVFIIVVAFLTIYINQKAGGSHKVFNQNWVVIGLTSWLILSLLERLRNEVFVGIRSLTLTYLILMFAAIVMGSLGVAITACILVFLCLFNWLGRKVFFLFAYSPIISISYIIFFTDFEFLWVNDYLNDVLQAKIPLDYSSGRFYSWDLAINLFREEPALFVFGGGLDNASNLYFANEGVTASGHNFWIESMFRAGLLGVMFLLLPFIVMYNLILKFRGQGSHSKTYVIAFVSMILLGFFYDLGGFTHLPGTFFLKGVLCCIFVVSIPDRLAHPASVSNQFLGYQARL